MALDWLPTYPGVMIAPNVQSFTVFVENLVPIPRPSPPTELTWLPHYPDRLLRAKRLAMQQPLFRWPMVPIADLRWLPRYPMQLRQRRSTTGTMQFTAQILGVQQVIAQQKSWLALYPNRLHRPARVAHGQAVWRVDPAVIIASATCIEWTAETFVRPTFTDEDLTRAQMLGDIGGGFLLLEDGGFILLEDGGKILLEDQTGVAGSSFIRPQMVEEILC